MTILITRPIHQIQNITALIELLNEKVIAFPTLEIAALKDQRILERSLTIAIPSDYAIFLSANAVSYSVPHFTQKKFFAKKIIAVGPGTAQALARHDLASVFPSHFSSEGILAIDELKNIDKKTITIFCGSDSPSTIILKNELEHRGACIHVITCYDAIKPTVSDETIKELCKLPIHIIVSTSLKSLKNLHDMLMSVSCELWLQSIPMLVVSDKMKEYAKSIGIYPIFMSANATDDALIAEIKKILKRP